MSAESASPLTLRPSSVRDWGALAVGALLIGVVSAVVFHLHAVQPEWGRFQGDLASHLELTRRMLDGGRVIPHAGFHHSIAVVAAVSGASLAAAATVVLVLSNLLTYAVTIGILRRFGGTALWQSAGLALLLGIAAAIHVPWYTTKLYTGIGTPNIWHSPTWVMMQPFALLSVWALLEWQRRPSPGLVAAVAAPLAVSTFVKPSWAVVILPVLGIVQLWHLRRPTWWHPVAMVAPTVAILAFQLLVLGGGEGGGIAVDPFTVWAAKTPSVLVSVLIAVAFPLVATVAAGRAAWSWWGIGLAWGVWLVGFLQRALLVEPARPGHGNWAWGYFMALKVVYVLAAVLVARAGRWRLPLVVLAFHVGAGVLYVMRLVTGAGYA